MEFQLPGSRRTAEGEFSFQFSILIFLKKCFMFLILQSFCMEFLLIFTIFLNFFTF